MIRNLKVLGFALAALFAMVAVTASAASAANGKLTADGPVYLDGTENPKGVNAITAFGQTFTCPNSHYHGEAIGGGAITPGAESGTLIPELNNASCATSAGNKMTVHMNGCDVVVHSGETTGTEGQYGGTGELVCPKGQMVDAEVFLSSKNENTLLCTFRGGAQSGSGAATITNTGEGTGKVSGTIAGIHGERSGPCGSATTESAEIHFSADVVGTNEAGGSTEIEVSE